MTKKNQSLLNKIITRFVMIIPVLLNTAVRLKDLAEQEARVAKRNVVLLIFLLVICIAFFTSVWFGLLTIAYIYLSHSLSPVASIGILSIINFLLLVIAVLMIRCHLANFLLFPETRRLLNELFKK